MPLSLLHSLPTVGTKVGNITKKKKKVIKLENVCPRNEGKRKSAITHS